jgi:2-methylisocitrate lyase-like PEP mutase family enzyme
MPLSADTAAAFRALHERTGAFVIPNPWDVGSARLLAGLGFEALATTSAGFAWTRGQPDGGVSREEALAHCREIAAATPLPVNADLEKCFADDPAGVAATIRLAGETGIAGASIEDASGDETNPIYDFDLAVERVRAGVAANRALAVPMLITARAENLLHGRKDLADTIRRLQAFEAVGADVLYAPGLATVEEIRAVTSAVKKPVNVLVGGWNPDLTVEEIAAAGGKRISVGGALARAALGAFLGAAREIRDKGAFTYARSAAPAAELNGAFARWNQGQSGE